jgi:ketosteroid isomerase-like protein
MNSLQAYFVSAMQSHRVTGHPACEEPGNGDTPLSMSQADIDTLRAEYDAMSRKDWAALFMSADPAFELKTPDRNLTLTGVFSGPERARRAFADFFEPHEEVRVEPEAFLEADGQIVVFFLQRAKPTGTNAFVEARAAHLWTIRDGKATRLEIFPRREEALAAAGLPQSDALP